jgi:outer membrane immunogenic protein
MRCRVYLAALILAGFMAVPAIAADLSGYSSGDYVSPQADFDGFYLGVQGGVLVGGASAGSLGIVAGVNFDINSIVSPGLEFQGDALLEGKTNYDFYMLGRAAVKLTNNVAAYGEAGPGWSRGIAGYAFGGGAEYAFTDQLSAKGEIQGLGDWGGGPQSARLQGGLLFHLK